MSIIDPKTSDLLKHADTRYTLAVEAAKRGRELLEEIQQQDAAAAAPALKPLKMAVEEINRGLLVTEPAGTERAAAE